MSAAPKTANKHIVRIREGGQLRSFAVSKDEFLIGREEKADIRIANSDVSSKHLYVRIIDGLMISLRDPGSTNGTFVAGERLEAGHEVMLESLGDEIMLGKVASVSFTPAALQAEKPQPKSSSRLSLVPAPTTPMPLHSQVEEEEEGLEFDAEQLAHTGFTTTATGRSSTLESEPSRVSIIMREAVLTEVAPLPMDPLEDPEPVSAALPQTLQPLDQEIAAAQELPVTDETDEADEAETMAREAAKAAEAAQAAALAAAAAHEKAKTAAAAREKAKAEKIRIEAVAQEKAKAEAAQAAAREKAQAAEAAEEAARVAAIVHERAKALAATEGATRGNLSLQEAAKAEVEAFKRKAIADIEVIQSESVSFAEALKQEGQRDADELRAKGRADAESIKEEAKREAEKIREEGRREAEKLREDVRRSADTVRDDARRDAELAKDEGRRAADSLREEGRRDTDYLRAQVKKDIDVLHYEGQKLKNEAERVKAEIDRLRGENERLRTDGEKLRGEQRDESGKLSLLKQEGESVAKLAEAQKAQLDAALLEVTHRRDALTQECEDTRQKVLEAASLRDSLTQERHSLEKKIEDEKAKISALKDTIERETRELSAAEERSRELKHLIRTDEEALKTLQESIKRERELSDADERKRKALFDALEAEHRVKRLSIDAQLGEHEHKRTEAERELQKTRNQHADAEQLLFKLKSDAELQLAKLKADNEAAASAASERLRSLESDAHRAREKTEAFKLESQRVQSAIQEYQTTLALFAKKTEDAKQETTAAQEVLAQTQAASTEMRKHAEAEISQMRALIEQESQSAREQVKAEIALLKQAAQEECRQEVERSKQSLQAEFAEKGKAMERELNDAKLRELKVIQQMQEDEKKALRARTLSMVEEIAQKTLELARQKPLEQNKSDLHLAIKSVIEGKSTGTLSVEADERTKKFWKKMAIRASVPAGIGLFLVIFPGAPGAIRDRFSKTVASEKNDSGVFLEQIKQRGLKFLPEMGRDYRGTYSDNILYVEDYVEMKLSDKEQKEWTLVLNDFIVGRLGLSDRIIPDFISAEVVMVQDLMRIREGILPQFKDQGFARMADTEKQSGDKLIQLLQGPENYQKFRVFEKDYYDNYIKRVKTAK